MSRSLALVLALLLALASPVAAHEFSGRDLLDLLAEDAPLVWKNAGLQARFDIEEVCDGDAWHVVRFLTQSGHDVLDETGNFLPSLGKCLHPTLGRVAVFHYDSVYNCPGCLVNDPPGVGDRQVRVCWHEFVLPKYKNCNPPVRVMTPRWP